MNLKFLLSEKIFILFIATAAMLFNLLPYIHQLNNNPVDKTYLGSFPVLLDKTTYLAEMTQGKEGNWKMFDKYTTEPQKPVFLYPLYLGLGHIARISNISVENIFLISRFFFGIILLSVVLYFIHYFIPEKNQRKIAYFLALFSSGMGWLIQNENSLDFWIPDAIPMVRFSYFPHFSASHFLFLGSIALFYHSLKAKNGQFFVIVAGILSFVLNFILPFTSILLYFLITSLVIIFFISNRTLFQNRPDSASWIKSAWKHNNFKNTIIFYALSLPPLFFMYRTGTSDPLWAIIEKQNILPTPSLINLVTGYGLILIFSLYGLLVFYKKDQTKGLFFTIWITAVPLLSYVPLWIYPMQRRFLETAFYVPLAITASYGIKNFYECLKRKQIKNTKLKFFCFFTILIIPFLITGNIQNWLQFKNLINQTNDPRIYLPNENIKAIKWLKNNSPSDIIILSSLYNGNIIPYYADRFVYAGHGPMTIDLNKKLLKTDNFYSEKYSAIEMFEFLKKERINYVFYSDEEKKLGDFNPEEYSFLKLVYQNSKAKIYKVE